MLCRESCRSSCATIVARVWRLGPIKKTKSIKTCLHNNGSILYKNLPLGGGGGGVERSISYGNQPSGSKYYTQNNLWGSISFTNPHLGGQYHIQNNPWGINIIYESTPGGQHHTNALFGGSISYTNPPMGVNIIYKSTHGGQYYKPTHPRGTARVSSTAVSLIQIKLTLTERQ